MAESGLIATTAPQRMDWGSLRQRLWRYGPILLAILGPVLAILTAFALRDGSGTVQARVVLIADLAYVAALLTLIAVRIAALMQAQRRQLTGTRLHLRLAGVFALLALVPTVMVAVFATLTVNLGMENWFSERIGSVVRNSLATAQAYEREHRSGIRSDAVAITQDLNRAAALGITTAQLTDFVRRQAALKELPEAFVFKSDGEIIARGEFSYLFNFEPPSEAELAAARRGEVVIIEDDRRNEIRALVYVPNLFDSYLYISRIVQGDVLRLLDETRETVQLYEFLESERDKILIDYAVIYLGFALIVILAAVLLGLWFAERLARPVARLASAAELVGAGDLDVRVQEERGNDEIAVLSRVFNRMTGQLKGQRKALVDARDETERRREFIEAVLSGVTAGVIGTGDDGSIDLINEAAAEMLGLGPGDVLGRPLAVVAPAFQPLLQNARAASGGIVRGTVKVPVQREPREFVARIAPKSVEVSDAGFVLTFDDMTALASAQRMAAWGDVARRIAHEIKNPLTPIQLSADRIRRKFATRLGEEAPAFEQIVDVIVRQTGEIRRMVDEFSKFARMPEPALADQDLADMVREAVLLQSEARPEIEYRLHLPEEPAPVQADRGLLNQCLTNLLQNAADALEARQERQGKEAPQAIVLIRLDATSRGYRLSIDDNGIGLPKDDRDRLTDPYVTTRAKGTGLGLAIVKKIIEQHGGEISLGDAAEGSGLDGAHVGVRLPKPLAPATES